uniref:Uncharacterized protein n=1 Tax=Siphoviridae sp. ctZd434 TaxID=2825559 RepID=A0A8S5UHJ8_9CAUD|nr:MAG TPA: hypothetical protein [Siphoviridae sp. ctZd434]
MANSSIITLLKRKIKSEIVNDPLIVKAFGSPDYDQDDLDWSGEDVGNNYIFTWNQNPETITNQITFITLQVNIKKYRDKWVIPSLEIWIYSHNGHMDLNSKEFPGIDSNRNDYLSQLLDEKFNGRTSIGTDDDLSKLNLIGELSLVSNTESVFTKDFVCRRMIFETKDVNSSMCDRW